MVVGSAKPRHCWLSDPGNRPEAGSERGHRHGRFQFWETGHRAILRVDITWLVALPTRDRRMSDQAAETKPERVLVVEDNEHAAYLLRTLLERAGYSVVVSPDGRDALAKLASMEPVDLVMLDLMLPYVSGYQVLIEARQDPKWQRVPIIVVTARTLEMDAVRALETGANDFIRKPFSPEELVARVRRAIELRRCAA